MDRSTRNNATRILLIFALNILVGLGMLATAQDRSVNESRSISFTTLDGGKVKLKIVTKSGDDSKIFEKTYDSYEAIADDPDLEEYGVNVDDLSFGKGNLNFRSNGSNFFIRKGFGNGFDDDDDEGNSIFFNFDADSLRSNFRNHFRNFGNGFSFNFDDDDFGIHIDSLRHNFNFGNRGKSFHFNGDDFEDIESLRERLREQMDKFDFDFDLDFGDWDDNGRIFHFRSGDEDDEDGFKVISRVKVFVRSAREADKQKVGADKMDELEIRDISFYPNPSNGRFTVDVSTGNDSPVQVKVINPDGGVVYDKSDQLASGEYSFKVDLTGKRKGIYILQVIQNNSSLTKRVIIE